MVAIGVEKALASCPANVSQRLTRRQWSIVPETADAGKRRSGRVVGTTRGIDGRRLCLRVDAMRARDPHCVDSAPRRVFDTYLQALDDKGFPRRRNPLEMADDPEIRRIVRLAGEILLAVRFQDAP